MVLIEQIEYLLERGWVARDADGDLYLYRNKPSREGLQPPEKGFWAASGQYSALDDQLFPSVTWDSDPLEVDILVLPKMKPFRLQWLT